MGKGGLVVTVPKGWAEYYGLRAGDRLEMIADGELTIRPLKRQGNGKAVPGQGRSFCIGVLFGRPVA